MPSALLLFLAFVLVPVAEIAVFIEVGGAIGLWPTLALIILTAMAGTWMIRLQGLATLQRARTQLDKGVMPITEVFDSLCLLVAGALLLTPGFITDAIGGLLLVPAVRKPLYGWMAGRREMQAGPAAAGHAPGRPGGAAGKTTVIEGQYEEVDPGDEPMPPPKGGWDRTR